MPSNLRQQLSFDEPIAIEFTQGHYSPASSPSKKQKMSLSQTYYIAASARNKLGREAGRPDHDLRLLVGHANLLDSLMLELADAEREQEAWFNQTVRKAAKAEEAKHIQWIDRIEEEDEEEEDDSDSDSDSDHEEEADFEMLAPLRRITTPAVEISSREIEEDEEDEDFYDEEDDEEHSLRRSSSSSPPELVHDDDSDDEAMPPSPPQPTLEFSEKQRAAIATTAYYEEKNAASLSEPEQTSFVEDGYFIPERNAPLIAAA